jgi:DNA-binding transcriptional MerR regulator
MTTRKGTCRIGALAARAGVSPDTIRHYERLGLVSRAPRDSNGYRRFPESAVLRVVMIQRALDAGFSLAELRRVLSVRDAGGVPCREVYDIAERRLRELDARIENLRALQAELRRALRQWRMRLRTTPDGQRAGLLDAWAALRREHPGPQPVAASTGSGCSEASKPAPAQARLKARRIRCGFDSSRPA